MLLYLLGRPAPLPGAPLCSWSPPPWSWRPVPHWSRSWPMFLGRGCRAGPRTPWPRCNPPPSCWSGHTCCRPEACSHSRRRIYQSPTTGMMLVAILIRRGREGDMISLINVLRSYKCEGESHVQWTKTWHDAPQTKDAQFWIITNIFLWKWSFF